VDSVIIPVKHENGQYVCYLPEEDSDYVLKLWHLPKDAFIVKCDRFPTTSDIFFRGNNMECKRADYALISESKSVIMLFELARSSGTKTEKESIAQLKGARCVIEYCGHISASFFDSPDIFDNFHYRYYIVRYRKSTKRSFEALKKTGGWTADTPKKIGAAYASFEDLLL